MDWDQEERELHDTVTAFRREQLQYDVTAYDASECLVKSSEDAIKTLVFLVYRALR